VKLFGDCEFIDTGSDLTLLSLGMAREDGAEFYAEPVEASLLYANDFVMSHVVPYLASRQGRYPDGSREVGAQLADAAVVKPRAQIAAELKEFAGPDPEWWTGWGAYDWVLISQLYGPLTARPRSWPMQPRPLEYVAALLGVDDDTDVPSEPECCPPGSPLRDLPPNAHHALAGAWWTKALHDVCVDRARSRGVAELVGLGA
jgi:hypothetical protein